MSPVETLRAAVYVWRCDVCSARELEDPPAGWSTVGLEIAPIGQPYQRHSLVLCPACFKLPLDHIVGTV
jgi:hypothetical protein